MSNALHPAQTSPLRLQHCADCGRVQYPRREVCGNCLSDKLEWRETSGAARVLSFTRMHTSLDPWFQERLPVDVVLVQLDAGPVCYAFPASLVTTGDPVKVSESINTAGKTILWALPA